MIRIFRKIYSKIQRSLEMSRYNDFTIAKYLRRQGAQIGEDNRIEVRHLGPEPYLIRIGNHCTIAPNVLFLVHDGATWVFTGNDPSLQKFGTIDIKDNCFIGMNSIIMGNVSIGPNSVVGAGSVVTKPVPPDTVVAGNPAKHICSIHEYRDKVTRAWAEQKPPGYFKGIEVGKNYPPSYIHHIKSRDRDILKKHLIKRFWNNQTG